jgi:hypothetical protein
VTVPPDHCQRAVRIGLTKVVIDGPTGLNAKSPSGARHVGHRLSLLRTSTAHDVHVHAWPHAKRTSPAERVLVGVSASGYWCSVTRCSRTFEGLST